MTTTRIPILVLGLLYLAFVVCLVLTADALPERVATHFDLQGRANGWMTRSAHLRFIAAFGLALPLVILGICVALRFAPNSSFNIPHREYWLAPERRAETLAFISRHSVWLACETMAFITGVHLLVVYANRQVPPQMPLAPLLTWAGCLTVGIGFWALVMIRHFKRRHLPEQSEPSSGKVIY